MKPFVALIKCLVLLSASTMGAQETPPFPPPPAGVSSTSVLAPAQEPGEPLVIRGAVYHADGTTPYKDLILYLYQTDESGVYNHENQSWREPRLRGWVKTGNDGTYEIRTIKPGSYPGSRNPAHIHAIIQLPGKRPQWIDDFLFEDDPFVTERQRRDSRKQGRFSNIIKLARSGEKGLLGTRDIKVAD
jgi:protocatechuate 3,4-dioxygenase beta subunit